MSSAHRTLSFVQLQSFFTTIRQYLKQRSIQLIRSVALTKINNSCTVIENMLNLEPKILGSSPLTNVLTPGRSMNVLRV